MVLIGFSSGLPLALTAGTLQAWMFDEGVDIKSIGLFTLVGLPYTLKFVWAPLMDRFTPKFGPRGFLGRRRSWMLISQLLLIIASALLGFLHPAESPAIVAAVALSLAFFSASQDIVIDAYRAEYLERNEYGAGASLSNLGYRLAMLTSGAGALILADYISWPHVYWGMSGVLGLSLITTLLIEEPKLSVPALVSLRQAVIDPFVEYFKRPGAVEILLFVILYKIGDVMAATLSTPFMMGLGFSKTEIGAVTKGFGLIATIGGGLIGGALMLRLGIKQALWIFGLLQAVSTIVYAWLAMVGKNTLVMTTAIGIENVCGGLGTAAFLAFLMSLCNQRFTATQYALLTSLAATCRVIVGAPTGYLAAWLDWPLFFTVCTLIAFPALLLLHVRYSKWSALAN